MIRFLNCIGKEDWLGIKSETGYSMYEKDRIGTDLKGWMFIRFLTRAIKGMGWERVNK